MRLCAVFCWHDSTWPYMVFVAIFMVMSLSTVWWEACPLTPWSRILRWFPSDLKKGLKKMKKQDWQSHSNTPWHILSICNIPWYLKQKLQSETFRNVPFSVFPQSQEGVEEKNPGLRDRLVLDLQEFNRIYPPKCLEKLQEMLIATMTMTSRSNGFEPHLSGLKESYSNPSHRRMCHSEINSTIQ